MELCLTLQLKVSACTHHLLGQQKPEVPKLSGCHYCIEMLVAGQVSVQRGHQWWQRECSGEQPARQSPWPWVSHVIVTCVDIATALPDSRTCNNKNKIAPAHISYSCWQSACVPLSSCCTALQSAGRKDKCAVCVQVVGVNEWNEDVLSIGSCDDSAQNLPLVHDKYDCPKLQVGAMPLSIC